MRRREFGALIAAGAAVAVLERPVMAAPVAALPFSTNFQKDLLGPDGPRLVVVLFSLPDCPYCDAIRREQLVPLAHEREREKQLIVREVSITGSRSLIDFDGKTTSEMAFAKRAAARFSPTVAFFGPGGEQVAEPIVGALLADFYGAYLDKAVHIGLARIEAAHR